MRFRSSAHARQSLALLEPLGLVVALCCLIGVATAELPPVPVPAENPITEAKRVLGKILFWDEQLSSNDTVACGTCHRPASGGSDPRAGRFPGTDPGTIDDVWGSPGIVSLGHDGELIDDPVFSSSPQVTDRLSPSNFGGLWAAELQWDGRAGSEFRDPLTDEIVIADGGALESQALQPLLNSVEMAKSERQWHELTGKLAGVEPLALASDLPPDVQSALAESSTYPALFETAFGDADITPTRIAFALATYQRTLVADQTAWDRFVMGDTTALSELARYGWQLFQDMHCTSCHTPPVFSSNEFFNIGLRRSEFDQGRRRVTDDAEDAGEMKVPSLRNVALRSRFMHTGQFNSLNGAVNFYRNNSIGGPDQDEIPGFGVYNFGLSSYSEAGIRAFLAEGLTDPRVRDETFPFDRPSLGTERPKAQD
jgi:cytochrome c peroxidase